MTLRQYSLRRLVGDRLVADDDLDDAAGVAQVEEGDPAVVAAAGHPPGEGDGLADVLGAQGAGVVGADHGVCSSLLTDDVLVAGRRRVGPGVGVGVDLVAAADVLDLVAAVGLREPDVRDAAPLGVPDLLAELLRRWRRPRWGCRGARSAVGDARRWPARTPRRRARPARRSGTARLPASTPSAMQRDQGAGDAEGDADAGVRRPAVAGEGVVAAAAADGLQPLVAGHEDLDDGAGVVVEAAGDAQVGLDGDAGR